MNILSKITHTIRGKVMIESYSHFINKDVSLIDVGCGNGLTGWMIKKQYKCRMDGADVKDFLEYPIPFKFIKNYKIKSKNNKYDIAMLNNVLSYVSYKDQIKLINECERIAKSVVIFESKPIWFEFLPNLIYTLRGVPFLSTCRTLKQWKKLLPNYISIKVKKPFFYPVEHYCFLESKNFKFV